MSDERRRMLEYFQRELHYLRHMGNEFALQFPKIARRLEIGLDECHDPHVERLLESFAFLTARLQLNLENEFPRISTALLEVLCPQLVSPLPSMTIACFHVDADQGKLTTPHRVEAGTPLFADTREGYTCRFRTCYPLYLLPIEVAKADFMATDGWSFLDHMPEAAQVLRLQIRSLYGNFQDTYFDSLRLYIHADSVISDGIYRLLFTRLLDIAVLPEGQKRPVRLGKSSLQPVGFGRQESVLPYPENAHYGYRLLHEYFSFPEQFLFFDITGLNKALESISPDAGFMDILLILDQIPENRITLDPTMFQPGCTPVINLFSKTSEPVRIDHTRTRYRLSPDARREEFTEIHSIQSVSMSSDARDTARHLKPFFSYDHRMSQEDHSAFWMAERKDTGKADLPGTEIYLSFLDLDFNPRLPAADMIFAHTLCTNRRLAEELTAGAILQIEESAPLAGITVLKKPTPQMAPPMDGATLWHLISHLSVNYLSLSNEGDSLTALREILRLYNVPGQSGMEQQISGIRQMECRQVVRRISEDAWRGFCKGMEIRLTLDERLYGGHSAFLLASVLNHFFPLYTSLNGFTQLEIRSMQREGVWKRWPPMAGEQILH